MAVRFRVSEQEFLDTLTGQLPSYEFVNGEVVQKPSTKRSHTIIARRIGAALADLEARIGGFFAWEPTTNLSTGSSRLYRVPDLAYWLPDRPTGDQIFLPPTLAIEIRSPGETMDSQRAKCREYLGAGVDLAWLVDPESRTVERFETGGRSWAMADGTLESHLLPGLHVQIADLFADLA